MQIKTLKIEGYEEVIEGRDSTCGLHAYIAVHSTRKGPSLGGIRMASYTSPDQALEDVLRLAKAMTYKAAAFNMNLGGGKAVIIGNPEKDKRGCLFRAMGRMINQLDGRYYAAKDAGVVTEDLIEVAQETRFVTGLPALMGGSDDPSPATAMGIFYGMRACLREKFGSDSFKDIVVAIQGLGHVGFALASLLKAEKAQLIITDTNETLIKKAQEQFDAEVVSPDKIYSVSCDIFSPCALGGAINDTTINQLNCRIVAGGANNQLVVPEKHGKLLMEKDILYAPDYVLNAGGLMNIYVKDILKEKDVDRMLEKIETQLEAIFTKAKKSNLPPGQVANEMTDANLSQKV